MGAADIRLRMATQDDAQTVASIITTVSEGVIEYLLGDLFPGMTPEKILEMILIRGSGNLRKLFKNPISERWGKQICLN